MAGIGISIGIARNSLGGAPAGASYLLDTYPALVAYDVAFQLKSDQVQMIEVREDGGGTFEWIAPSGGVLDETALLAHTGANNGYVRTLKDAQNTATTLDLSQATAGLQPQIVSAGVVNKVNGKPALSGTPLGNQVLTTASFPSTIQPSTYFGVCSNSGASEIIWYSAAGPPKSILSFDTSSRLNQFAGSSKLNIVSTGQALITALYNGASSLTRINGANEAVADCGSNEIGTTLYLMNDSSGNGIEGLQNSMFYSTDQTANFTAIETAINDLYGVYV